MRAGSPYIADVGSGRVRGLRALAIVAACASFALFVSAATAAGAAPRSSDLGVARAGLFVASDFAAGFTAAAPPDTTHTDQISMARGVEGCGPYVAIQKKLTVTPTADSMQYSDHGRTIGNEVAVLASDKAAASFLVLYEKPSMVGCLENYLEKQFRRSSGSQLDDVTVALERQDIAGLGDASVLYEGVATLELTDGTSAKLSIGTAVVRVGRAIDSILYSTSGASLTDVLTPAIDASVGRLRTALTRSNA